MNGRDERCPLFGKEEEQQKQQGRGGSSGAG